MQLQQTVIVLSVNNLLEIFKDSGGATLLSTGNHESGMGCRQLEIRRIEL